MKEIIGSFYEKYGLLAVLESCLAKYVLGIEDYDEYRKAVREFANEKHLKRYVYYNESEINVFYAESRYRVRHFLKEFNYLLLF